MFIRIIPAKKKFNPTKIPLTQRVGRSVISNIPKNNCIIENKQVSFGKFKTAFICKRKELVNILCTTKYIPKTDTIIVISITGKISIVKPVINKIPDAKIFKIKYLSKFLDKKEVIIL